jgi:hypothetical protein
MSSPTATTTSSTSATTYPPAAHDNMASTSSTAASVEMPKSRPKRVLETGKEKFERWIDYEPHVVEAAPVDEYLRRATHINYPKAAGAYVHRLFPFTNVRAEYVNREGRSSRC